MVTTASTVINNTAGRIVAGGRLLFSAFEDMISTVITITIITTVALAMKFPLFPNAIPKEATETHRKLRDHLGSSAAEWFREEVCAL